MRIGDVKGYVPLSLMSDPPPRSAREFMKIGESITLVVESFAPDPTQHRPGNPDDDHGQAAPSRCAGRGEAEACQEGSDQGIAGTDLDDADERLADGQVDAQLVDTPAPKKRTSKKTAAAAVPSTPVAPKARTRKRAAAEASPAADAAADARQEARSPQGVVAGTLDGATE